MPFVGRLEPENNAHLLVRAWARVPSDSTNGMKLVDVHGRAGPGPLRLDRVEEIERATRIAETR